MNDATRLDPAERERCKPLARRILNIERQVGLRRVTFDWLRAECRQQSYVWGDLFLQVLEMGARYQALGDGKSLARAIELRADLRAFLTDDSCLDDADLEREKA